MLFVAASPVLAYAFVGSSGILAPSTANLAELYFGLRLDR